MHVNLENVEKPRSNAILAAVFFLALLLGTGCGEKPAAPTQEQRTEEAPRSNLSTAPAPTGPVVVTFGDSLTAGVAGRSYPENLQDLLTQNGYKYQVENQGVSGDTTTDGLARIENVIAAHPALVVLEFGGNDGLRGTPIDATRKNLEEMITRIQAAKIPIIPFLLLHVYQNPQLMQPDGIHPNGEGNKIVAQDVYNLIAPLLKRS